MDVPITIGPSPSVAAQVGKTISVQAKEAKPQPVVYAAAAAPKPSSEPVQVPLKRTELDVDKYTGLFIGKVVEAATGAVVAQVPSEAIVRLFEKTREMVGKLLNRTA